MYRVRQIWKVKKRSTREREKEKKKKRKKEREREKEGGREGEVQIDKFGKGTDDHRSHCPKESHTFHPAHHFFCNRVIGAVVTIMKILFGQWIIGVLGHFMPSGEMKVKMR